MAKNTTSSGGIGVAGLLGVAFVVLKMCKVIDWDWLWVLAPFWIPVAILLAFLGFMLAAFIFAAILSGRGKR